MTDIPLQQPEERTSLLGNRNFRMLWIGESVSLLGDQFHLIALPWLALQLTGSGLALGTVLMAAGIPRALFMLVGGALVDRFSPRTLMLRSNVMRALLTAILTVMVMSNTLQFWMLYIFAFIFGTVDAFFHPAYMAMLPRIVRHDQLEQSNALLQGTSQIMATVGPAAGGLLVGAIGVGAAFALDSVTFMIAATALSLMSGSQVERVETAQQEEQSILASIREGFVAVRADATLFAVILVTAAINFLFMGPISVGLAALANQRFFTEGAAALGYMSCAFGLGAIAGVLIAGVIVPRRLGVILMLIIAFNGLLIAALGIVPSLLMALLVLAVMGLGSGYINVLIIAWLQKRPAPEVLGRVMSLLMLSSVGLQPISNAVAGALVDVSLMGMFMAFGIGLFLVSIGALGNRDIRSITP